MRNNQPVNGNEYVLPDDEVLVTRTDLDGHITYVNDAFLRAGGYTREELMGQPHNIVRHPDMPPDAFADLWGTIRHARPWSALVKNRRKGGGFYWSRANVSPVLQDGRIVGYLAVRTRPSASEIAEAQALYDAMREGRARNVKLLRGKVRHDGVRGLVERAVSLSFFVRSAIASAGFAVLFAASGLVVAAMGAGDAAPWLYAISGAGVVAAIAFGIWSSLFLGRPLDQALATATHVAIGDVTHTFPTTGDPEAKRLWRMLDQMNAKLIGVLKDVAMSIGSVHAGVVDIAGGNRDLSQRTEQQAAALEETAASMEQLTVTVRQNADHARQANELAAGAAEVAARGGETVGKVVHTMTAINQSSRKIADIIGVIDGIAFQTNILALNAAVEAARAGEQGRGFAVVAGEVRSLAQRSAGAAKEIKELIDASVATVEVGAREVDAAGRTMTDIVDAVRRVRDIMAEIAGASDEQSRGIEQVNAAVSHMDQTTQHNAALVEEVAAATEALSAQVEIAQAALGAFQLSRQRRVDELVPVAVARSYERSAPREALALPS